jgi:hypothetical protein
LRGHSNSGYFLEANFSPQKRSTGCDMKFIEISFEKLALIIYLAGDNILFKEIVAFL